MRGHTLAILILLAYGPRYSLVLLHGPSPRIVSDRQYNGVPRISFL